MMAKTASSMETEAHAHGERAGKKTRRRAAAAPDGGGDVPGREEEGGEVGAADEVEEPMAEEDVGEEEERHAFMRAGASATWMCSCPNDVGAELAEELVDDAERRMRVLAWIVRAGVSPGLVVDSATGLTLLRLVRGWVRSKMREVSLLDELRDEHVAVFGWTEVWREDGDFLADLLRGSTVV